MAFDESKLKRSRFRNAVMLIEDITEVGGQKTVIHEYVNSDSRTVESLGELQPSFSVNALVHGDNYFADRDAIVAAMITPGVGTFVHPFEGSILVHPLTYTLSQTDRRLGTANFTLLFARVQPEFKHSATTRITGLTNVASKVIAVSNAIVAFIGDNLSFANSDNFVAIDDNLSAVANAFQDITSSVTGIDNQISIARATIDNFNRSATGLIRSPVGLGESMIDLFDTITELFDTPEQRFTQMSKLYSFGDAIGATPDTTFFPIKPDNRLSTERQLNQNIIKTTIQVNALAQSYLSASETDYNTVVDIDVVIEKLDAQFLKTAGQAESGEPSVDTVVAMDTTTLEAITDLRNEVRVFLDLERVNALKIDTVQTKLIPLSVLTYKYYGDVDNLQQLSDINDPGDISNIVLDVAVVTQ